MVTQHATVATRGVMQAVLDGAAAGNEPLLIRLCPGTFVYLTSEPLRIDSRSFVGIECAATGAGESLQPLSLSSRTGDVQGNGQKCVISGEGLSGPMVHITSSTAVVSFDGLVFKARELC